MTPAMLDQAGGGVLTLEGPGDLFDGIVFGECEPRRWMAGSDFFHRTWPDQSRWPDETADVHTLVQIAITYEGQRVTLYRDGAEYAEYNMSALPAGFGPDDTVLIGRRHLRAGTSASFAGTVAELAHFYDRVLTAAEIAALRPDQPSEPWAVGLVDI